MIARFWLLEGDGNLGRCRGFMSQGRRLLMTRRPSGSAQQRTALAVFVSDFAENTCLCVVAFLSIVSIVFLAFLVLPVFPFYFVAHRLHPFTMSCCSNFSLFAPFALLFFVSSFLFLSSAFPSYPFVVLSSCFICFARCCSFHIFPVLISCSCFNLLTLFTPCIFPHISFFICPLFAKCTTFVPFFILILNLCIFITVSLAHFVTHVIEAKAKYITCRHKNGVNHGIPLIVAFAALAFQLTKCTYQLTELVLSCKLRHANTLLSQLHAS